MAKTKISEFSATPGNNTDIDGINIAEGCAPSGINDAIRELMAQLKDWQAGTSNDPYVVGSSGSLTLSYGTANGVPYLNGSKVLTSGSALTFDGTNLGIGTSSPGQKLDVDGNIQLRSGNRIGFFDQNYFIRASSGLEVQSADYIRFLTNGANERVRVTSAGDVGIGTSSPTWKTTVVNGSTPRCLQLSQYATNNIDKYSFISAGHYTSSTYTDGFALIGGVGSSGANAVQIGGGIGETLASSVIQFYTAANNTTTVGTERMRIDSSGNVGIGTSSPTNKLTLVQAKSGSSAESYNLMRLSLSGTRALNDTVGIRFGASGNSTDIGAISCISGADDSLYGTLTFATRKYTTDSLDEAMRIDNRGNLLVGTTSNANGGRLAVTATWPQTVQSLYCTNAGGHTAIAFLNGGTQVGRIDTTSTATSYVTSSDYRLKENIAPMTGALSRVAALKPVTYAWKSNGKADEGFIAHELAEVCPSAVVGEKDAVDADGNPVYQGIDTSFLVATLTAAIQELKAINDAQAETITALTARVTALETN